MTERRYGAYEVGGEVGRGGMAVVYRGRDPALDRPVAIKVLHPHLAHEPESRARFHREARAVAQLHHPNIIEIFAYSGSDSPETYIVTEFVDGPDLKRFTAKHRIRLPQIAAMLALQVARALAHAHSHGIVHRDIKPENILIQRNGQLKLTDFGIAHLMDDQMTITGAILGSPAYMSPEHVEGRAVDARADVFSLGTLLYMLAAGELPFRGENPHSVIRQVLECDIPDPRLSNPLIDDRLLGILRRAMRRLPAERYQHASEMADDLRAYLEEEGFREPDAALRLFLADPEGYQEVLGASMAERLVQRARETAARGRIAAALEIYDRVLALDDQNVEVVAEVRRLTARRRLHRRIRRGLVAAAALAAVLVVATLVWNEVTRPGPFLYLAPLQRAVRVEIVARAEAARRASLRPAVVASPPAVRPLPLRRPPAKVTMKRTRLALAPATMRPRPVQPRDLVKIPPHTPPATPEVEARMPVVIKAFPPAVQIAVDGVHRGEGKTGELLLAPGWHEVRLHHPACSACEVTVERFQLDVASPPTAPFAFSVRYRPARVTIEAPVPARVYFDRDEAGPTARPLELAMGREPERSVDVRVEAEGYAPWSRRLTVLAGQNLTFSADLKQQ